MMTSTTLVWMEQNPKLWSPLTRRRTASNHPLPEPRQVEMPPSQSDAFVFFGATGDLAYKQIFPASRR